MRAGRFQNRFPENWRIAEAAQDLGLREDALPPIPPEAVEAMRRAFRSDPSARVVRRGVERALRESAWRPPEERQARAEADAAGNVVALRPASRERA